MQEHGLCKPRRPFQEQLLEVVGPQGLLPEEKPFFRESQLKEWEQWLRLGAAKILTPEEAAGFELLHVRASAETSTL